MISFHQEDVKISFNHKVLIKKWIEDTIKLEGHKLEGLTVIFCSDDYLLTMNRRYLKHDYYTDILTFPLHDPGDSIEGELYISTDRIKENASQNGVEFKKELLRVIIHGVLHLCGYDDQDEDDRAKIRSREDYYLNLLRKAGLDFS